MSKVFRRLLEQGFTKQAIQAGELNNADLSRIDFAGIDFSTRNVTLKLKYASFIGSSFKGVNFNSTFFDESSFTGTDFRETNFEGATFVGTIFDETDFSHANFNNASFKGANFNCADFSDSGFKLATFVGSDMSRINLTETIFTDTDFSYVNFGNASMIGINTKSTSFINMNLGGSKFTDVRISRNSRVVDYKILSGGYMYQAFAFKLSSGANLIRLGCFCRTVQSWNKDFWNNKKEFNLSGSNVANARQRLFTFSTLKLWLEDSY